MTDRTILLDVDGVLLAYGTSEDALLSFLRGDSYQPGWRQVPSRRAFDWTFPDGVRMRRGICPQALRMLQDAHRHGARILWCTSWLVDPAELARLAAALGLGFVEFPTAEEMPVPATRHAIPAPPRNPQPHFKLQLLFKVTAATTGEVLMVDDHAPAADIDLVTSLSNLPRVASIRPDADLGLGPEDASRIRRWARGKGPLPR